jgi:hypothetical protein
MIEYNRDFAEYEISCDFCSEDIEIEADDWNDMLSQIDDEGWEYRIVGNEWKHKCPTCVKEGKPWVTGGLRKW